MSNDNVCTSPEESMETEFILGMVKVEIEDDIPSRLPVDSVNEEAVVDFVIKEELKVEENLDDYDSMSAMQNEMKVYVKDDSITETACECSKGACECCHSPALVSSPLNNLSRTDTECSWEKRKQAKDVKIKTISDLYPPPKNYKPFSREITEEERNAFYEDLKQIAPFTGMAWLLSPEPVSKTEERILSNDIIASNNNDL